MPQPNDPPRPGAAPPADDPAARIHEAARARSVGAVLLTAAIVLMAGVHWTVTAGTLPTEILMLFALPAMLVVVGARYLRERGWLLREAARAPDRLDADERERLDELLDTNPVVEAGVGGFVGLTLFAVGVAIMAPPCAGCRAPEDARTVLRSDLRELQSAQELFYNGRPGEFTYTLDVTALELEPSEDVTIRLTSDDPEGGYAAVASHADSPVRCALWVGEENRVATAPEEGTPACRDGDER